MSVDAIGSSNSTEQTSAAHAAFKQMRTDFKALSVAMKNNDLAGAQKAYAAIQKEQSNMPNKDNNPLSTDFSNLGSALSSGDMASAQKAFATLQQDGQKLHHGHHHHGQAEGRNSNSSNSGSSLLVA